MSPFLGTKPAFKQGAKPANNPPPHNHPRFSAPGGWQSIRATIFGLEMSFFFPLVELYGSVSVMPSRMLLSSQCPMSFRVLPVLPLRGVFRF